MQQISTTSVQLQALVLESCVDLQNTNNMASNKHGVELKLSFSIFKYKDTVSPDWVLLVNPWAFLALRLAYIT